MKQETWHHEHLQEKINNLSVQIEILRKEKQEIQQKLDEERLLNQQLMEEKNQMIGLDFSWTGNLGHWYWNVKSNTVTFNPLKITTLGYNMDEVPESVNYQFFTDMLHPDDYQKAMEAMMRHLHGNAAVYEVEYRIRTKAGDYKCYYDRGRITQYDEDGKPLLLAGIVFDVTEKKELMIQLEKQNKLLQLQSSTDGLTGLSNHRFLIEALKKSINDFIRTNKTFCVAIFDVDNFKKINDTMGHLYGDKILSDIASMIKANIRDIDVAGRYGGEEFMVILADTTLTEAYTIAERIREVVEKHIFDDEVHVTISGGVEEIHQGDDVTDIISSSDKKLYIAKNQWKNKIIF